jgi:hypothetical protein
LLEVSNQQVEGRGGIVEAALGRDRSLEQPGAPEEGEEDDRGRGGALEALVPATVACGSRSRGHRCTVLSVFTEGGVIESECVHGLGRGCREHGRSGATQIAEDTIEFCDPDPFLQVRVRSSGGSAPRFVGCLGQNDDLRRRRVAADLTDQTGVRPFRHALVQDDRVWTIVPGKVGDVHVRKRDREQLEPALLHEELNQRPLQGDRDGDEDPQCWVRSSCQTRVLGSHIRSVVAHRRPRDEKLAAQPPGGRAFTVARLRSKSDTSTAGHGWVTWETPTQLIWTISQTGCFVRRELQACDPRNSRV